MKKYETIIYYNENNFGQVIATIYGSCYYFNIEGSKPKKQNKTKTKTQTPASVFTLHLHPPPSCCPSTTSQASP